MVGWLTSSVFGQWGAVWDNDAAHTPLLPLPNDWSSIAWGMNDLGEAIGESHPPFRTRAGLWTADTHTPVDLGVLPGDLDSSAIGYSLAADGSSRQFLWEHGVMGELASRLDASGSGWIILQATALNHRGQIVGLGRHDGVLKPFVMTPLP